MNGRNRLHRWFRARCFSIVMFRKHFTKGELVWCLDNIESTLESSASTEEKVKLIQNYILMHKVNLKWMVGIMEREQLEDIYQKDTAYRPEQPERMASILKFRRVL